MLPADCDHPKTTVYQERPGWTVRECLHCGKVVDEGPTHHFQR